MNHPRFPKKRRTYVLSRVYPGPDDNLTHHESVPDSRDQYSRTLMQIVILELPDIQLPSA